ncbi:hypothetical protein GP486_004145 [Trichoglossum hirsutum]|uniref:Uncharacterized protein n=1 Tax=Trichoglossum hirsutum TaxID=265104 RepID=A0A9P8LBX8_9PEZI|nr:hypothetical protein GP486_004145 [Trichoglossum hirsutum]
MPHFVCYLRELAELRRDVFGIVEEEIRTIDDTIGDRLLHRLQDAFDSAQAGSGSRGPDLTTPSSSEIASQQLPTEGLLVSAAGSTNAMEITEEARTAVEPEQLAMIEGRLPSPYFELEDIDLLFKQDRSLPREESLVIELGSSIYGSDEWDMEENG